MSNPKYYIQLLKIFDLLTEEIKSYFECLPDLIKDSYPYDVSLAYMFSRVERAHRRTLYCGIVKKYSANSELTDEVTRKLFISREEFQVLFKNVFGKEIDKGILNILQKAEKVRDKGMHGKDPSDSEIRNAINELLTYSNEFNDFVHKLSGFKPFGSLRGFKGRAENMDKETTRLILKGLEFKIQ